MVLLDLSELDTILRRSSLWGKRWWHLARFKREDFHGDPDIELSEAIRQKVRNDLNIEVGGRIMVLANLRYFGYNMNPLVTYYCYDTSDRLQAIVAEVNNTPWGERHAYCLACDPREQMQHISFDKVFTVSPFNPLNMEYRWRSTDPAGASRNALEVHIENFQNNRRIFDASIVLNTEAFTAKRMVQVLLSYPLMTLKVIIAIYWEALRLYFKSVPFLGKNKTHQF